MTKRDYWLGFAVFSGIGPKRFATLLEKFGNAKDAWNAPVKDLDVVLGPILSRRFATHRSTFSFEVYKKKLEQKELSFVTLVDNSYPQNLKQIPDPPFVLFVKGNLNILSHPGEATFLPAGKATSNVTKASIGSQNDSGPRQTHIGIVGTRKITSYGRQTTEMLTQELVRAGCVTVSGLALGVDAVVHRETIDSGGKTIAVLGCGIECCYPSTNQAVYNSILISGGAIVSEYPLTQPPSKGSFPMRNKIIAGISDAVLVTEGAEDSGSLITAEYALEFGRPVFAVPGPITSQLSKGPNSLLAKGAKLVTSGEDILREFQMSNFQFQISNKREVKGETEEEQIIIDLLKNEPLHFDEIIKKTGLGSIELGSLLSFMEMKGFITSAAGTYSL